MTCVRDLAMKTLLSFLITLTFGIAAAQATVIQTNFDPPGVPLGTGAFTIGSGGKTASFSGGTTVTQGTPQFYRSAPAAYLISGAGAGGAGAVGLIDFDKPAQFVSFFAVNGGNGQAIVEFLDPTAALLTTIAVTASVMTDPAALILFSAPQISLVRIINPGPASPPNPPYLTFVDDFTARIPEPGTLALFAAGLLGLAAVRRRVEVRTPA